MIYKHEDGTINTFYQKGETVEYPSDEEVIKYIDNAESWDAVDNEVYEELCERLGINSSEFDDPDFLFEDIKIHAGCEPELTKEQIEFYTKSEFDGWMRIQIYMGFQKNLTIEQIKMYTELDFDGWQMREIRKGFENGLSNEQVQFYAKPEFDSKQMKEIREGFENGLMDEEMEF